MSRPERKFKFDDATAVSRGARDYQEDAIIADFANGADVGFAVLSDGMGGHAAGDVASKIVVTEVFSELMFRRDEMAQRDVVPDLLRTAAESANDCLNAHVQSNPATKGMGATLVSMVIAEGALNWLSIGDSPLYLFRDNALTQLNEDHSLGPHIDMLVKSGAMSMEEGKDHPERNALTSVLLGQDIALIDCPDEPYPLVVGDILILASDGLQYLEDDDIARILRERPFARSAEITEALMQALHDLDDPDLDNVTIVVLQVQAAETPAMFDHDVPMPSDQTPPMRWPFRMRKDKGVHSSHAQDGADGYRDAT